MNVHMRSEMSTPDSVMLPSEEEKAVMFPRVDKGKILIREDTFINNFQCAGCGRTQLSCSGVKKQWSALCWGQKSNKKQNCMLVFLSAVFALSLIGTVFFCFTNTINDVILSSMVIRNNSIAYSMWRRPTVRPLMKVYLFNYTNWKEVKGGREEKLKVEEVGPYVYSQKLERVNVTFQGDHLTFRENNEFEFLPEKSSGTQFDSVLVPNLPLMALASKTTDFAMISQFLLVNSVNIWANHREAFLKLPVQRFLWGYSDTIINMARSSMNITNFRDFGLLVTKNGTTSDNFTINTGENDKNKMNLLEKFDGRDSLSYWGSPECNSIEASDGTIFPPTMLNRNTTLFIFFANLCRRLPFEYIKDVEIGEGIQLLRYGMPENVFDDLTHNPANQCFCDVDSATCPPRGVINVTACTMGVPVLASFPHFYLGDPKIREDIIGLKPNASIHTSYLDIHPTLGIALSGKSSLQLNIQVKRNPMYDSLSFLKQDLILPIAWIEMSVEELPDSLKTLVYHGTYSTAAAQLGLTVFCIVSLITSSVCLSIILIRKRKQKPCLVVTVIQESDDKSQIS